MLHFRFSRTLGDPWCLSRPPTYHQRPMVSFPTPPPTIRDPWCLSLPPTYHQRPMVSFPILPPTIRDPWCLSRPPPHLPSETHGVFPDPPSYHQRPMASSPNSPPKGGSRACVIALTTSLRYCMLSSNLTLLLSPVQSIP